jgi:hypothetical protein
LVKFQLLEDSGSGEEVKHMKFQLFAKFQLWMSIKSPLGRAGTCHEESLIRVLGRLFWQSFNFWEYSGSGEVKNMKFLFFAKFQIWTSIKSPLGEAGT